MKIFSLKIWKMDKNDIFDLIFDDKSVKPKSNRRAKDYLYSVVEKPVEPIWLSHVRYSSSTAIKKKASSFHNLTIRTCGDAKVQY